MLRMMFATTNGCTVQCRCKTTKLPRFILRWNKSLSSLRQSSHFGRWCRICVGQMYDNNLINRSPTKRLKNAIDYFRVAEISHCRRRGENLPYTHLKGNERRKWNATPERWGFECETQKCVGDYDWPAVNEYRLSNRKPKWTISHWHQLTDPIKHTLHTIVEKILFNLLIFQLILDACRPVVSVEMYRRPPITFINIHRAASKLLPLLACRAVSSGSIHCVGNKINSFAVVERSCQRTYL